VSTTFFITGWILIGCQCFYLHQLGKKIVLKVIPSSYRPGCEQAFKLIVYIDCLNQFKRTAL